MNPEMTVVPVFGVAQTISLPIPKLPKRYRENFDWISCKSNPLFRATEAVNKKVESFRRRNQLGELAVLLRKLGLDLYCDFTPVGKMNQDLAIINWFRTRGRNLDFDYIVYFEYDVFTTQSIEKLYSPYLDRDAGFVNFRVAEPDWTWTDLPAGAQKSVQEWLKKRGAQPTIYSGFFPGHFLSRKVLRALAEQRMPSAFCEMRLPSVVAGLGFSGWRTLTSRWLTARLTPRASWSPRLEPTLVSGFFTLSTATSTSNLRTLRVERLNRSELITHLRRDASVGGYLRTGIFGGGLTGLTLGYLLSQRGVDVEVLEKEKEFGGLMRTLRQDGFTFDWGGSHIIFSKNKEALNFLLDLLGENKLGQKRNTKVLYKGSYVKYPFENGLSDLPKQDNFECLYGFVENLIAKEKGAVPPPCEPQRMVLLLVRQGHSREIPCPVQPQDLEASA